MALAHPAPSFSARPARLCRSRPDSCPGSVQARPHPERPV